MLATICSISALFVATPDLREAVVRYGGYFFVLTATMLFLVWLVLYLVKVGRAGRLNIKVVSLACLSALVGACALFVHADFGYKIAMDEYILASTAKNLHEQRQVLTDVHLLRDETSGELIAADSFVDKRLWLYPFYVSKLHDILGYNVSHGFVMNAILGIVLILLAYLFGNYLSGTHGGILTGLLLAGLPLVAQNATGGGMELLGLVLLLAVMLVAVSYLHDPSRLGEGALVMATVLLSYSRYELSLFVLPVSAIVILGWIRSGRILLSFATVLAPLLLIAHGLHILDYLDQPDAWELTRGAEAAFSWQHLPANLPHALAFLFSWEGHLANSPLLSILGSIGLISFPLIIKHRLRGKKPSEFSAVEVCLIVFPPFLLLQFVLVLGFHASRLDSPFVSRYALIFYWLLAVSAVFLVAHVSRQFKAIWNYAIFTCAFFVLAYTLPVNANPAFSRENFVVNEDEWLGAIAEKLAPDALWVDRFLLTHAMRNQSSIGLNASLRSSDTILGVVDQGIYTEVLYVERLLLEGSDYVPESYQGKMMREAFEMETIKERSFRPYSLTRVCRILSSRKLGDE